MYIKISKSVLIFSVKQYVKNYLCYGLSHSLELGAFFMQFLTWWHSENLQSKFIAYPIPNPPKVFFLFYYFILFKILFNFNLTGK